MTHACCNICDDYYACQIEQMFQDLLKNYLVNCLPCCENN